MSAGNFIEFAPSSVVLAEAQPTASPPRKRWEKQGARMHDFLPSPRALGAAEKVAFRPNGRNDG